jgi:hypothetical protein
MATAQRGAGERVLGNLVSESMGSGWRPTVSGSRCPILKWSMRRAKCLLRERRSLRARNRFQPLDSPCSGVPCRPGSGIFQGRCFFELRPGGCLNLKCSLRQYAAPESEVPLGSLKSLTIAEMCASHLEIKELEPMKETLPWPCGAFVSNPPPHERRHCHTGLQ